MRSAKGVERMRWSRGHIATESRDGDIASAGRPDRQDGEGGWRKTRGWLRRVGPFGAADFFKVVL